MARGAGDLFVRLVVASMDAEFEEWRNRLLMCSAMSMREVYDNGRHAHGSPTNFLGAWDRSDFNFEEKCWSQRATNESMVGAVSPVALAYSSDQGSVLDNNVVGSSVFSIVNDAIVNKYEKDSNWTMPNEADRELFLKRLRTRMLWDEASTTNAYLANVGAGTTYDGSGTSSARNQRKYPVDGSDLITFLGVPPSLPLTKRPPVSFMDLDEDAPGAATSPQGNLLRRMFWRAHPEDTCEEPGLVTRLRDKCIAGAEAPGGDPEACTRCVEVAELQMPTCFFYGPGLTPSKCSALGYANLGGIDPIYGVEPSAPHPTCVDTGTSGLPAYYEAFHYCTGTDRMPLASPSLIGKRELTSSVQDIDCLQFPGGTGYFDTGAYLRSSTTRVALGRDENERDGSSWVPPLVTAINEQIDPELLDGGLGLCRPGASPLGGFGIRLNSSLDDLTESLIAPAPLWDDFSKGLRATWRDNWSVNTHLLSFEVCGVTQRATYVNRDCLIGLDLIGRRELSEQINHPQDADTGALVIYAHNDQQSLCSIKEERRLKNFCYSGTCNANGLCTSQLPPTVTIFHAAP